MKHVIESFDSELPTHSDIFLGFVKKTCTLEGSAWLQAMSLRIPMVQMATFEALAEFSGKSKSRLMLAAFDVALENLWDQLGEEDQEALQAIRSRILGEKMENKEGVSGSID